MGGHQGGREGCGIEPGEPALGLIEAADQEEAADFEIARMGGIALIAMFFERHARLIEHLRGPGEVA